MGITECGRLIVFFVFKQFIVVVVVWLLLLLLIFCLLPIENQIRKFSLFSNFDCKLKKCVSFRDRYCACAVGGIDDKIALVWRNLCIVCVYGGLNERALAKRPMIDPLQPIIAGMPACQPRTIAAKCNSRSKTSNIKQNEHMQK